MCLAPLFLASTAAVSVGKRKPPDLQTLLWVSLEARTFSNLLPYASGRLYLKQWYTDWQWLHFGCRRQSRAQVARISHRQEIEESRALGE
jgi:hypothetical protein